MARDRIEVVQEEHAAVERLLAQLEDGDLGVVLAEDVRGVLEQLRRVLPGA